MEVVIFPSISIQFGKRLRPVHTMPEKVRSEKFRFQMSSVHTRTKSRRFQMTPFDGLVWTVGLTVEEKAAFLNSSGLVRTEQ